MKKFLALVLCCLMTCSVCLAEENTMETRELYRTPEMSEENTMLLTGLFGAYKGDLILSFEGYGFSTEYTPTISFVFKVNPQGEKIRTIGFTGVKATQNDVVLDEVPAFGNHYILADGENAIDYAHSDPEYSCGFEIPYQVILSPVKGEERLISLSFSLEDQTSDVILDMSYYGIPPITVPIPSDAFVWPQAE